MRLSTAKLTSNALVYQAGNHNVICDICGYKKHRSQVRLTWDYALACVDRPGCWYRKHELDTPPPVIFDGQAVQDARPDVQPTYLTIPEWQRNLTWNNVGQDWNGPPEHSFDPPFTATWSDV